MQIATDSSIVNGPNSDKLKQYENIIKQSILREKTRIFNKKKRKSIKLVSL